MPRKLHFIKLRSNLVACPAFRRFDCITRTLPCLKHKLPWHTTKAGQAVGTRQSAHLPFRAQTMPPSFTRADVNFGQYSLVTKSTHKSWRPIRGVKGSKRNRFCSCSGLRQNVPCNLFYPSQALDLYSTQ